MTKQSKGRRHNTSTFILSDKNIVISFFECLIHKKARFFTMADLPLLGNQFGSEKKLITCNRMVYHDFWASIFCDIAK